MLSPMIVHQVSEGGEGGRGRGGGGEASILPRGAPNKTVIKELNVDVVIKTMFLS